MATDLDCDINIHDQIRIREKVRILEVQLYILSNAQQMTEPLKKMQW